MMFDSENVKLTAERLARYDRPGPRYTSYPTALEFGPQYTEADYRRGLGQANDRPDAPLAVYTHLPFCEQRCDFCGCHVIATKKREVSDPYLASLLREIDLVAELMPQRRQIAQYHLGGGTPTYLQPAQLEQLVRRFGEHFSFLPDAELAIEVDPRVTTDAHIDVLAELGFNRISLGAQDFAPEVQAAIGREQTVEETRRLAEYARSKGLVGLNIDLIYGLPKQRLATFAESIDAVIGMGASRVAVYSFAYVPWLKANQKRLAESDLPDREKKFALLALTREKFLAAGYQAIGMDHFALPDDELSVAQREGRLYRNFMGYTVMPGEDALGFGISAIGDVAGAFVQNEKKLVRYNDMLADGKLPVEKGYKRSDDDELRRTVIQELMCNFRVQRAPIESRFGVDFDEYFADEITRLRHYVDEGLCTVDETGIHATELGELFVRNLAMCFDAYLAAHEDRGKKAFSRTV